MEKTERPEEQWKDADPPYLIVKDAPGIKGKGLFISQDLSKDAFVCHYRGITTNFGDTVVDPVYAYDFEVSIVNNYTILYFFK